MNEQDETTRTTQPPTTQNQNPQSYNFLLRMSKRMGTVATQSYVEVKQFLNKEITVSPAERFMAGMPRLRLQKQDSNGTPDSTKQSSGQGGSQANEGSKQATAEKEKDIENGEAKIDTNADLNKIIRQSHEVLAEANTVFPITLFPDTVLVDRTKVTIIRRDFFWSSDTMSFRIEDVLNVEVTVGPLFGSLTIASRVMSTTDHFQIKHFWRNDAIRMKRIIQGYVIAMHNKLDVAHLKHDELVKTLNELGHDRRS